MWFQIWHLTNLVNFHPTTRKSENFTPMGYFCPKYVRFELKKYRGVIFHDTEQWCKIWKTLTFWFKNGMRNWGDLSSLEHPEVWKVYIDGLFLPKAYTVSTRNFKKKLGELSSLEHPEVWKLYIDGLFLSKAYTISTRNFQRNYVSWHWRVLQSLNENWLVGWKMTRNLVNFHARVESPKIYTLIESVCPKHTNI